MYVMGWDLLLMPQSLRRAQRKRGQLLLMVLSQTMGAASRKVRYLKPSAFEIPRCCWENKQENTVVTFQNDMFLWCFLRPVLPWWGGSPGEVELSRAGRLALLSHSKLPCPRLFMGIWSRTCAVMGNWDTAGLQSPWNACGRVGTALGMCWIPGCWG